MSEPSQDHGEPALGPCPATADATYTRRLQVLEFASWKRRLDVQAPYRWNVRRLCPGRVLDLGCGVGRNLAHLDGRGIGVDHNEHSVAVARSRGCVAFTPTRFRSEGHAEQGTYDTLLAAHLLEHVTEQEATDLLRTYLPLVTPGGRVVLITPQERGWRSDATHVRWMDFAELRRTSERLGLRVVSQRSFPFPRAAGHVFRYNEFVHVATVPTSG